MTDPRFPRTPQETDRPHLTVAEVAELAGVSDDTVYRAARRLGRKVFGRWQLDPALVDAELSGRGGAA